MVKIVNFLKNKISSLFKYENENTNMLLGKLISLNFKNTFFERIDQAEFKVFSQWGDDGIIQYLISNVEIEQNIFVEFGVENYKECNTRYLLMNNNWSGLVIDGDEKNINYIKKDKISWCFDLISKASFINTRNINEIILESGIQGKIGLLSIDIDGNDYWVWQAITIIQPTIVICEYNSVLGYDKPLTIPYDPNFIRNTNYNILYAGASLLSLCDLAEEKGYSFVGSNSNGNNAYFILKDKLGKLKPLTAEQGYVKSKFRELTFSNGERVRDEQRINQLKGLPFFDTRKKIIINL